MTIMANSVILPLWRLSWTFYTGTLYTQTISLKLVRANTDDIVALAFGPTVFVSIVLQEGLLELLLCFILMM